MELDIGIMYLKRIIVDLFNRGIPLIDKIQEANEPEMVEAFESVMKPKSEKIMTDLEIGIRLVKQLKQLHPSVVKTMKDLF